VGTEGIPAVKGSSNQQLRGKQKIPVLKQAGVSTSGNSAGTIDDGPMSKSHRRLPEQLPRAKHPGLSSHQPPQCIPGKRLGYWTGLRAG
jgi:hypothetical protein